MARMGATVRATVGAGTTAAAGMAVAGMVVAGMAGSTAATTTAAMMAAGAGTATMAAKALVRGPCFASRAQGHTPWCDSYLIHSFRSEPPSYIYSMCIACWKGVCRATGPLMTSAPDTP